MQTQQRWLRCGLLAAAIGWLAGNQPVEAQYTSLHNFTAGNDGAQPFGSLTLSGSTLYGTTEEDESSPTGTVFKINCDGTGYAVLHNFVGGSNDGLQPYSTLTIVGSTLYGTTGYGGSNNGGVIFKINSNGTGYTNLYNFASGSSPGDSLSLSHFGNMLYGTTGGGHGTAFKINTNGTGYTILHNFAGGSTDGSGPGGLIHPDRAAITDTLYGMTYAGGSSDKGVVYKIYSDGTGYTNLHYFAGGSGDGAHPFGSLTLSGSTLYGMTENGGSSDKGVLFKINTDGSGFAVLHTFFCCDDDGGKPVGSLTLSGSTLYGVTTYGGSSTINDGTVFQINTNGTGYTILRIFTGNGDDGALPQNSLTLSGYTLYGTTERGGGWGNVFALTVPWDTDFQDLGSNWRRLTWFGDYVELSNDYNLINNWIWHNKLGYFYCCPSSTPASIWLWSSTLGWIWTSSTTYPYLYSCSDAAWLWYQPGSAVPCWFYNFKTGWWEAH